MTRRVLALAADGNAWGRFFDAMAGGPETKAVADRLDFGDCSLIFERAANAEAALNRLRQTYFVLLLLDLRADPSEGLKLLEALDHVDDQEARYGFHRIVALVGNLGDETDRLIAELGARGIRHIYRERPPLKDERPFPERILRISAETIAARAAPKRMRG